MPSFWANDLGDKMRDAILLPGYDARKAAQVAAYFALKQGGRINVLKLAKLLYLSEREFMARYDAPMFYDRLVSMPDGPVTSVTLNLINGNVENRDWYEFVSPRDGYMVSLAREMNYDDLDELSRADVDVLARLWERFGSYDGYRLRDYTHMKENIPEWKDPKGSSVPIPHARVFASLNKSNYIELAAEVSYFRRIAAKLSGSR